MEAFVIKGWDSKGREFFVANIERGDGCWSEVDSVTGAQLFSFADQADRVIGWLQLASNATFIVKTVTVTLEG